MMDKVTNRTARTLIRFKSLYPALWSTPKDVSKTHDRFVNAYRYVLVRP